MAIESALSQDFDSYEIIISDDASTDGSQLIIKEYKIKYPDKINIILSEKNEGLAANRDRSIKLCRGTYIAWLDADDTWYIDKLRKQVLLMNREPDCILSYHNMFLLQKYKKSDDLYIRPPMPPKNHNYLSLIKYQNYIPSSSVMIRKDLLSHQSYHLDKEQTYSDFHFFVRLARLGRQCYLPEPLGYYRRHDANAVRPDSSVRSGWRIRSEKALRSILAETPEAKKLVRYALARFYISQLRGAMREHDWSVGARAALLLLWLLPQSAKALVDRRANRNLLPGFKY